MSPDQTLWRQRSVGLDTTHCRAALAQRQCTAVHCLAVRVVLIPVKLKNPPLAWFFPNLIMMLFVERSMFSMVLKSICISSPSPTLALIVQCFLSDLFIIINSVSKLPYIDQSFLKKKCHKVFISFEKENVVKSQFLAKSID